jgi:hypothetical protein
MLRGPDARDISGLENTKDEYTKGQDKISGNVRLVINASKANKELQKVNKELEELFGVGNGFNLDINSKEFGRVVNAYVKGKGKGGSYRLESVSESKMQEIIEMATDEAISISINNKHPEEYYTVDVITNDILNRTSKSFPWGFTKKDI